MVYAFSGHPIYTLVSNNVHTLIQNYYISRNAKQRPKTVHLLPEVASIG